MKHIEDEYDWGEQIRIVPANKIRAICERIKKGLWWTPEGHCYTDDEVEALGGKVFTIDRYNWHAGLYTVLETKSLIPHSIIEGRILPPSSSGHTHRRATWPVAPYREYCPDCGDWLTV